MRAARRGLGWPDVTKASSHAAVRHRKALTKELSNSRAKIDRTGEPSITETEKPRSANLLQMPRGLMCKLRQRGRDYGGRAGFRGIDPSLQPLPFAAIAGAAVYGQAASTTPSLNPNSDPVCPACNIGVALFAGLSCISEWPISASTRAALIGLVSALKDRR